MLVCSFSAFAQIQNANIGLLDRPHVRAEGKADTTVVPDLVEFGVSVYYVSTDASKAKDSTENAIQKIQKTLFENGVSKNDVSVYWAPVSMTYSNVSKAKRVKPLFYTSSAFLSIKLKDLVKVSTIISSITDIGVQKITPLVFKHTQEEKILFSITQKASLNAKAFAEAMTSSIGGSVGKPIKVVTFDDNGSRRSLIGAAESIIRNRGVASLSSTEATLDMTGIGVGSIEFSAKVVVYFELK